VRWVEQRDGTHAGGGPNVAGLPVIDAGDVIAAVARGCDLLVVSHVFYATGQLLQRLPDVVAAAHRAGALVVLDTYHSAGVMPVGFDELGPDFAIGGNYKYTRGGPGAGWLAIHPRHLAGANGRTPADHPLLRPTLDTGWFAKRDTFGFQRPEQPLREPGGDAWLENTPTAAVWYQARSGLRLTLALGVERLRAYSLQQQAFLVERLRERGVPVRDLSPRGAYVLVPAGDHNAAVSALKARGVNSDARLGHVRLCPDILNTRDEMARAAEIVAGVLATTAGLALGAGAR
jgi:kynureninase